jgi:hypothetical protein
MAIFLPSSIQIRRTLSQLFSTRTRNRRRVILVAYVGQDAPKILPDYKDVELYCWGQAGATHPAALDALEKRGAIIHLCDGLHAKLYWVEEEGYVVTSANLSKNALGERTLREVGLFSQDADEVDIVSLIKGLDSRPLTVARLRELQRAHDLFWSQREDSPNLFSLPTQSYSDWFDGDRERAWKLAYWEAMGEEQNSVTKMAESEYGRSIVEFIDCSKADYDRGDWVFYFPANRHGKLSWVFVDRVCALLPQEAEETGSSHQAIQIAPLKKFQQAPFKIAGAAFRHAFANAAKAFGLAKLQANHGKSPPERFLQILRDEFD